MFQNFDDVSDSTETRQRVEALRSRFDALGIDGFVVPRADRHQNEYIPESEARLAWLTGFTGSAGTAVVLADRAALLSDGRYTIQMREQLDLDIFEPVSSVETSLEAYLSEHAKSLTIGVDPWLTTIAGLERLERTLDKVGGGLVRLTDNPIDGLWQNRPAAPAAPLRLHDEALAGRTVREKFDEIAGRIAEAGADLTALTDPASVAWAFNIRGSDVAHTPLVLSFAIIRADGAATLFVDEGKVGAEEARHLAALATLRPYEAFADDFAKAATNAKVGLDRNLAAAALAEIVEKAGGNVVALTDPASLPRATKTAAEIAGSRDAHRRDGAAMVAFLAWLDDQAPGSLDEIGAAKRLESCRVAAGEAAQRPLRDISFDTISGAGPHGAVVHYRVSERSNRRLQAGELYLVDSGGQYEDGTTDITRTVPIGEPTDEMRRMFTLVLKGMIAISTARFPKGTRGVDLDGLARIALWKSGCDYAHGTGHGVGAFLAVHEGPQSLSRRGMVALEPGMILSNEPGYYKEGAYGIRIENLVLVEGPAPIEGGDRPMLGFETLTLAPIDRRLIDVSLLVDEERVWLDAYHARVASELAPLVTPAQAEWLKRKTAPL
ncbi:MAG: aminopeptidase P family protein [Fulvimarina manganoxydans]|uniref:aminopeptidase P family protein n=1 Tax=Fulvimarina manganoxydans TaxID=937218 RepID=UPI0023533762|nr:aminopeptidase P family protein [Fulvimarina manganoxydans]MCK5934650.1 aminopeptidase P family protein [Fulvimarina manganoxydans]